MNIKYHDLCEKIKRFKATDQSLYQVQVLTFLGWEKEKRDAARRVRVLERADLLLNAFLKNGSMSVILLDGRQLTQQPSAHLNPIYHFYNAESLAERMAELSVPYD